ncbi:unnamed protein product [Cyprideis torosa]|uniref:Fucosyltransferase n=1 Tax=Cyprideis torosa TaxID=163714 RepID=A0A7R8WLU2_9CRUS|nr:unnamed protein product [Cyprideis torosa]CAG0902860.1 unnamed protein product [Cyprideis torosa]
MRSILTFIWSTGRLRRGTVKLCTAPELWAQSRPRPQPVRRERVNATLDSKIHVAFAFISECWAQPRLAALEALEKHFPGEIHVFGGCGIPQPKGVCKGMKERSLECLREFSKKYWFYLAFENAVCEEYVTEKLARGLDTQSIPISMADQTGVRLPPRSYLKVPVDTGKVTDEGMAELAQQMKKLMADREEYMR